MVKICNQLVKKVKKYSFSDRYPGGQTWFWQGAKSILEKSQRAKRKFWGQQVLFGTKFLKFGPKRANLATLVARAGLRGGQRGQLSRALRCKGAPRDEMYLFQIKYSFEKFRNSEAIQECNSILYSYMLR